MPILNKLLEWLTPILLSAVLGMLALLWKQAKRLPKLFVVLAQNFQLQAAKTAGNGDDVAAAVLVAIASILDKAVSQVWGDSAPVVVPTLPIPPAPDPVVVTPLPLPDNAGTIAAAAEAAAATTCGKQVEGGTGRCTLLRNHVGDCVSAPFKASASRPGQDHVGK